MESRVFSGTRREKGGMETVNWSDLPHELLSMIADRLYSRLELIRFRSVCRSWRSSSAHQHFPIFSLQLAPLIRPYYSSFFNRPQFAAQGGKDSSLSQATYFRFRPSLSSSKGWLIKLEELESGKVCCLSPLSRLPIHHSCESLDLLGFQVCKVYEAYAIIPRGRIVSGFKKVVLFPDSVETLGGTRVLTIGWDDKLRYWDHLGETWIKLDDQNSHFHDMIIHKGQLYVVDGDGIVSWVDSSLNLIQYAPPLGSRGGQKNFVESCGQLYIVSRCLVGRTRLGQFVEDSFLARYGVDRKHCCRVAICDNHGLRLCTVMTQSYSKAVSFKVYRLNEEWGKWEGVKTLNDQAFIMATDCCFSISAHDFDGCLENSIYFTNEQDDENQGVGLNGHDLGVFKLDDGSIQKMASFPPYFQLFCPSFLQM